MFVWTYSTPLIIHHSINQLIVDGCAGKIKLIKWWMKSYWWFHSCLHRPRLARLGAYSELDFPKVTQLSAYQLCGHAFGDSVIVLLWCVWVFNCVVSGGGVGGLCTIIINVISGNFDSLETWPSKESQRTKLYNIDVVMVWLLFRLQADLFICCYY